MSSDSNNLMVYGWNSHFERLFQTYDRVKFHPGRVVLENKGKYQLQTEFGEITATVSGRLRYEATAKEEMPAVGDWVAAQLRLDEGAATIHEVLRSEERRVGKECRKRRKTNDEEV